jgi:hypothetical protein
LKPKLHKGGLKMKKIISIAVFALFMASCGSPGIIPEMKDFIAAFESKQKMDEAVQKYASKAELIPEAVQTCDLGKPNVTKTEKKEGRIVYTAEAVVRTCDKSPNAVGTIRIFQVGWEKGKIVSFEWLGPKGGKVEY